MLLYENKKVKFLNILKIVGSPFNKFVSTGEIKEDLGFVQSRQELINSIVDIIENNENFILPIIGDVGTGKTHLFWALNAQLYHYNSIYISLENIYRKFFYNTYSEFIETLGIEPLRNITKKLCDSWGAREKKFGFFHVVDIEKVRKKGFEKLSNKFEDKIALTDVINAITAHQLDPYKKNEAENWLLGELMDFSDLSRLNLLYDLRRKSYAYTTLKLLIENSKSGSVVFIDDFEKIISITKPEIEADEIFDRSWLYGDDASSPEKIAAQKTLNKILSLQKIRGLRIIITLKSIDSLEEIIKQIREMDEKLLITLKKPYFISNFVENDIFNFYKNNIELFLENTDFLGFIDEFPNSYFPLNEGILKNIYKNTQGNPRQILKFLIKIFNEIIFSDEKLEDIIIKYENID